MNQDRRIVGKNVLESLTTGMYSDSRVIFREYVQNSTDAIDKAIAVGILAPNEGRIDITLDLDRREIRVCDNGTGILSQDVYHVLGDVGKSQKSHQENRGFRGIGRLGGLGYCDKLQFVTSYKGESCKTITLWNCRELRRLLQPHVGQNMSLMDVVDAVTSQEQQPEEEGAHYFEVILTGITEGHSDLLDVNDIKNYLSQVAPVPFDYRTLMILQKINRRLHELGKVPEEFNIYLNGEQIYKPYKVNVLVETKGNKYDHITDIEFFEDYQNNEGLFFCGWYGVTQLSGIVKDETVNGLRIRKRNILIGDNRTADAFFGESDQRFNRWFVGEIYVFDDGLIPNSRRDNFEKNAVYFEFKRKLEKFILGKLKRLPGRFSDSRTNDRIISETTDFIQAVREDLDADIGVTETQRGRIIEKISQVETKVKRIKPQAHTIVLPEEKENAEEVISSEREEVQEKKNELIEQLESLKKDTQIIRGCPKITSYIDIKLRGGSSGLDNVVPLWAYTAFLQIELLHFLV